jgi:hypothetical protein
MRQRFVERRLPEVTQVGGLDEIGPIVAELVER